MAVTKDYPKEIQEGVKKTEEYYKNSKHQSIKRYGYYERLLQSYLRLATKEYTVTIFKVDGYQEEYNE